MARGTIQTWTVSSGGEQRTLVQRGDLHDAGGRSKPRWPRGSDVKAVWAGENDCYRLKLTEKWNARLPPVMFVLMNPSVASIDHADPTLIRTGQFARTWDFGTQLIGNVHAYRATDSQRLLEVADPVGPGNDQALCEMAREAALVVLAYGKPPRPLRARADAVVRMLAATGTRLTYLRLAKDGTPWHPLYLPGNLTPQDYVVPD